MYELESGRPRSEQRNGASWGRPSSRRRSIHFLITASAPASTPTVRLRFPLPRSTAIEPAYMSTSFTRRSSASEIRKPARYSTVMSARFRRPSDDEAEQAMIRRRTSSGARTSTGYVLPLLAGSNIAIHSRWVIRVSYITIT